MTPAKARQAVYDAVMRVDSDCFPGRVGMLGVCVDQRGALFDVVLSDAGHLFHEFDAAIRAVLGDSAAIVKDMETGYCTSSTTSAPPVMPPTIINNGPVGAQQVGTKNNVDR